MPVISSIEGKFVTNSGMVSLEKIICVLLRPTAEHTDLLYTYNYPMKFFIGFLLRGLTRSSSIGAIHQTKGYTSSLCDD
ncbi:hypothetical protein CEXT_220991 [Caerostris extrusa]|uniref:Uncharacterized protein n=1 Tax=Caerostris extrusa TaxID=172846 RepID=A0AAV4N2Y7_CAEEX|nr:hypothetical protein CEXT_220991 [Caerostris extrusa]